MNRREFITATAAVAALPALAAIPTPAMEEPIKGFLDFDEFQWRWVNNRWDAAAIEEYRIWKAININPRLASRFLKSWYDKHYSDTPD